MSSLDEYVTVRIGIEDGQPRIVGTEPHPWMFEGLPAVPERVTALEDPDGVLWIRGLMSVRWHQWTKWSAEPGAWREADWLDEETLLTRRAPLVEHPDPRKETA